MAELFFNEVLMSEVPEKQAFGAEPTKRSMYIHEMLDAMMESKGGIFEVTRDEDGNVFTSNKQAAAICSSFSSAARQRRHRRDGISFSVTQRGKRVFVSKVKVSRIESKEA